MRPQWRIVVLLTLVVAVSGASRLGWMASERLPMRREIRMRGNSFAPHEVRVAVGDTVEWLNGDIVRHNAVSPERFDSGDLKGGERFAWVPADTGVVEYRCTIHARMRGTIRVRSAR